MAGGLDDGTVEGAELLLVDDDLNEWVGGWVGWIEENEAVGMSYCKLGVRWVGGWVTHLVLEEEEEGRDYFVDGLLSSSSWGREGSAGGGCCSFLPLLSLFGFVRVSVACLGWVGGWVGGCIRAVLSFFMG